MNIYEQIGLQRVVNASGRMSILGVSTIDDQIALAMKNGGQSYVVIDDLIKKAGEIISFYTNGEDSCPVNSASAGISMSVAAIISKGKKSIIEQLPDSSGLANEIILQKGHCINYGAPIETTIRLGGGVVKAVGTANLVAKEDIEEAISEKTAALMYVKSHHCVQKGMQPLQTMIEISQKYHLPLIVDAASEEDLRKYIALGANLVIYSGAKAIEGPTSGFVTGNKKLIEWVRLQSKGIGRSMKIGKESIMGLLEALKLYEKKDNDQSLNRQQDTLDYLIENINRFPGCKASCIQDEAGRAIYRCQVIVDEIAAGKSALQINRAFKQGEVAIYVRDYLVDHGIMVFDPRALKSGDKELIVERLQEILNVKPY